MWWIAIGVVVYVALGALTVFAVMAFDATGQATKTLRWTFPLLPFVAIVGIVQWSCCWCLRKFRKL